MSSDASRVSGFLNEIGCKRGAFVRRDHLGGDILGSCEIFRCENELQLRNQ
jgi:hypothetical protein